jgi:hypothetical protein
MAIDPTTKQKIVIAQKIGQCLKCFLTMFEIFYHELLITTVRDQKFSIAKSNDQKLSIAKSSDQNLSIIQVGN